MSEPIRTNDRPIEVSQEDVDKLMAGRAAAVRSLKRRLTKAKPSAASARGRGAPRGKESPIDLTAADIVALRRSRGRPADVLKRIETSRKESTGRPKRDTKESPTETPPVAAGSQSRSRRR